MTSYNIDIQRFKDFRNQLGLTQKEFGEELDMKSTVEVENSRVKLPFQAIYLLVKKYDLNLDWLFGMDVPQYLNSKKSNQTPSVIVTDLQGRENIVMVGQKAHAGYTMNISEEEYYSNLPSFYLPLPEYRNQTFRGFQVTGNSMMPVYREGDWLICNALESIDDAQDGKIYLLVTSDSILIKLLDLGKDGKVILKSINKEYQDIVIDPDDLREIWQIDSVLKRNANYLDSWNNLDRVKEDLSELEQRMMVIKSILK